MYARLLRMRRKIRDRFCLERRLKIEIKNYINYNTFVTFNHSDYKMITMLKESIFLPDALVNLVLSHRHFPHFCPVLKFQDEPQPRLHQKCFQPLSDASDSDTLLEFAAYLWCQRSSLKLYCSFIKFTGNHFRIYEK